MGTSERGAAQTTTPFEPVSFMGRARERGTHVATSDHDDSTTGTARTHVTRAPSSHVVTSDHEDSAATTRTLVTTTGNALSWRASSVLLAVLALTSCAARPLAGGGAGAGLQLTTATGSTRSLASLTADHDATVLVFWSAGCPCVRRYQARVDALLDRAPGRLQVFAVSANAGEDFSQSLAVAQERGVRVPLLRDETGALAAALGARSTPTVVLLDRAGVVRFFGWLDNEREPGSPDREAWLEHAIDGVLGDGRAFQSKSPTWGCTITRRLFTPEAAHCSEAH